MFDGLGDGTIAINGVGWGYKDEIRISALELSHPNLSVYVSDPLLVTVSITASVKNAASKSGIEAATAVKDTLSAFISPNVWDWSPTLRYNDLIARVANAVDAEGESVVTYVESVGYSITDCHIPDNGLTIQKAVTSLTMGVGNLVEVNVSSGHDIPVYSTVYVAINVPAGCTKDAGWYVYPVDSTPTANKFVLEIAAWDDAEDDISEYAVIGWIDADGNLVISDAAPLLVSDTHEVIIV